MLDAIRGGGIQMHKHLDRASIGRALWSRSWLGHVDPTTVHTYWIRVVSLDHPICSDLCMQHLA